MRIIRIAMLAAVIAGAVVSAQAPVQQPFRAGVEYEDGDDLHTPSVRTPQVRRAAKLFIEEHMGANDQRDGRFRKLDVRVARDGVMVRARKGYALPQPAAPAPSSADIDIPHGYRDWRLISVAREEGPQNDIRAILGNDVAITAYREATRPFPDGTIIARLAWSLDSSEENNKAFGRIQSFVAGAPKNGVQFMIKDAAKYAATGGWGFVQFNDDGKRADEKVHSTCFSCHRPAAARDFVFTHYSR